MYKSPNAASKEVSDSFKEFPWGECPWIELKTDANIITWESYGSINTALGLSKCTTGADQEKGCIMKDRCCITS